jgi:hypothetical protein
MEKSFRKRGRDRQTEKCKKSAYVGEGGGSGKDLAHLEAGLEAIELVQGNRKYRGRVWCRDRKGLDIGIFLPFISMLTEIV